MNAKPDLATETIEQSPLARLAHGVERATAVLCIGCDWIYDSCRAACPRCAESRHHAWPVARSIPPAPDVVRTV